MSTSSGPGPGLRFGEGRISGAISVLLGACCLLGALCFHFPEYLTTPELRATYDVALLRDLLAAGLIGAAALGTVSMLLWKSRALGFTGVALALAAQWLGGANVRVDDLDQPVISFGFDWLVLALLANTLVFTLIERLWPLRRDQLTFRPQWKLDFTYYAFNHLMVSVVLLITTFFSERLFGWAVHDGLQGWVRSQPVALQIAEVLVVADLAQYWGHRWMHASPTLWRFHAVHHCPAEMDWLSGSRMHFLEVLFTRSTVLTPIYLLGFAESAVSAYVVWVGIQSVLVHSNTRWSFGPLRRVLASPHFHHWHHAADAEAIDKNFAAHLPLLDVLFGTYVDSPGRWPERYGVVGKPLPEGFLAQHLYPFVAPGRG